MSRARSRLSGPQDLVSTGADRFATAQLLCRPLATALRVTRRLDMVPRRPRGGLQAELLHLLQPRIPRRAELVSERVAPTLASIGDSMAGRPAEEVLAALDAAVRDAGATPDRTALREFAAQIEAGENPFS